MKKNNAGFSLVELIVVIAVMVVIMGVGGSWIIRLSGYHARECASKITSSLTQAKVQSMSKSVNTGDSYWMVEKDSANNRIYVTTKTPKVEERVRAAKTGNITVSYVDALGASHEILPGYRLVLAYARGTGEIYTYMGNSMPGSVADYVDSSANTAVKQIIVTNGSRTYTIEVTAKTGKVEGTH